MTTGVARHKGQKSDCELALHKESSKDSMCMQEQKINYIGECPREGN